MPSGRPFGRRLRSWYEARADEASGGREEGFVDRARAPAEHRLGFVIGGTPDIADDGRLDDVGDAGPIPQDEGGFPHRDGATIAAGDETLPRGGGRGHRAEVDVGDVAHVGDGKTEVCHLLETGGNEGQDRDDGAGDVVV